MVGCEPSEVYCLKYEYVGLLPERRAEIESITKKVWLVDEFLLRIGISLHPAFPKRADGTTREKITFQPHCHQSAEGLAEDGLPSGTSATVEMLKMFGFDVNLIEAGCCGMAGSFGYDAEHYELSMQVGELGVLPKIRELGNQGSGVVSSGAACRMQIEHGAGIKAQHPLVLVRDVMLV